MSIKKEYFFLCILGYRLKSEIRFPRPVSEIRFFPISYKKRKWGTREEPGFFKGRGGGDLERENLEKKIGPKNENRRNPPQN